MSTKSRALIAAFLISAVAAPTVATAQQKPAAGAPAKPVVSKEAQPALVALEKAVKENRTAEIPALGAAAVAASKTNTDRYFAYRLQLPTLAKANNDAALLTGIEGVLATGIATGPELANLSLLSAKLNFNKGAADTAATTLAASRIQQAIQLTPNDGEAHYILGLIQNRQKRPAEAVASLQKAQQLFAAAGKPYDANIADQLFGIAYTAKLPVARDLAMAQLKATPSAKTWRTAVKITEQSSNFTSADKVDLFRLQRATNSLEGEGDYYPYVDALMTRGLPGEAKAVLEEAFAAGKLDKSKPLWRDTYNSAVTRNAADKSAPNGDVLLGRGEYAKAAAAYRADAAKGGAGADLANLRLGIALARSGDKAGATAALNAVKGQRASIAQMWLVYLQSAA